MNSVANRCLHLTVIGLGMTAFACTGEAYPEGAEENVARSESELVYAQTVTLGSIPTILEGDGDLWTQNGRNTSFFVSAFFDGWEPNNVAVYWVQVDLQEEFIPDHTRLEYAGPMRVQMPTTWTIQSLTCNPIAVSGVIQNKSWTFKTVYQDPSPNTTTNCFSFVSIKADGDGWDNSGNAQVKITFSPTVTHT